MASSVGDEREGLSFRKLEPGERSDEDVAPNNQFGDEREGLPPAVDIWEGQLDGDCPCFKPSHEDLQARVGQLTQERDNAWAAAEQDQLWRESLLRRITELETALLVSGQDLMEASEQFDIQGMQKAASVAHQSSQRVAAVLSTSKEET